MPLQCVPPSLVPRLLWFASGDAQAAALTPCAGARPLRSACDP